MFDISIGTLIPGSSAVTMIPQLNEKGFECYQLDFGFRKKLLKNLVNRIYG